MWKPARNMRLPLTGTLRAVSWQLRNLQKNWAARLAQSLRRRSAGRTLLAARANSYSRDFLLPSCTGNFPLSSKS